MLHEQNRAVRRTDLAKHVQHGLRDEKDKCMKCKISHTTSIVFQYADVQRQKAVSAYFTSKQILPVAFAEQYGGLVSDQF